MKKYRTNVFLKDHYLESRHQKLYAILGERLYSFLDLFHQGQPNLSIGVFDDCDRIYLDMILGEQGLTIDTMDDFHHYKGTGRCEDADSLLKQMEGVAFVPSTVVRDDQAKAFCKKTREMIYRIFGTNIICLTEYKNPVAVLCKEYNQQFVVNCINDYHGPRAQVETFMNTPSGYIWVLSCGA